MVAEFRLVCAKARERVAEQTIKWMSIMVGDVSTVDANQQAFLERNAIA